MQKRLTCLAVYKLLNQITENKSRGHVTLAINYAFLKHGLDLVLKVQNKRQIASIKIIFADSRTIIRKASNCKYN